MSACASLTEKRHENRIINRHILVALGAFVGEEMILLRIAETLVSTVPQGAMTNAWKVGGKMG